MYLTLPSNVMVYIRELLLQCFADETEKSSRNKIGDAVAEVARQLTDASTLPNAGFYLFVFIFHSYIPF